MSSSERKNLRALILQHELNGEPEDVNPDIDMACQAKYVPCKLQREIKIFSADDTLTRNRNQAVASLSSAFAILLSDFDSERAENKRFRMVSSRVSEVTFRPNKSLT